MARRFEVNSINLEMYDIRPFVNERGSGFVIEWDSDIGFGEYTIYKRADSDEWRGENGENLFKVVYAPEKEYNYCPMCGTQMLGGIK